METDLDNAAHLMAWLMQHKDKSRSVALLIATRKFKIPFSMRSEVSKRATQLIKHPKEQLELL